MASYKSTAQVLRPLKPWILLTKNKANIEGIEWSELPRKLPILPRRNKVALSAPAAFLQAP